jgi:hypothetical protein
MHECDHVRVCVSRVHAYAQMERWIHSCTRMFQNACVCVYLHTHGQTHTDTHVLHVLHTYFICLCDMHYRERDTYEQCVYKYSQMHAVDMGVDTHKHISVFIHIHIHYI